MWLIKALFAMAVVVVLGDAFGYPLFYTKALIATCGWLWLAMNLSYYQEGWTK